MLTEEEQAIIAHVIADPQSWIDNAIANGLEWAIQEKINKYRQEYLDARYLSITVDPDTGEETRVENPDYKTRAERDALEEAKRDPFYGKTEVEIIGIKKEQLNAICQRMILARFPLIHQLDVANGLYADAGMKAWIAAMIAESNRCCDLIDLNQVPVPVWPEYVEVV